jgi:hypothetical protein
MPVLSPKTVSSTAGSGMASPNAAATAPSNDLVHIAVINTVATVTNQNQNHLLQVSKANSLQSIVEELCTQVWKLDNPDDYALAFESKEYVTEKSKVERIQNGTILKLLPSPRKLVHDLLHRLATSSDQVRLDFYLFLHEFRY